MLGHIAPSDQYYKVGKLLGPVLLLCVYACVRSGATDILQSDPIRVCAQKYFVYILTRGTQWHIEKLL